MAVHEEKQTESLMVALQGLESKSFLHYGAGSVAYIKPITLQNQMLYAVHGADGKALAVVETLELAQNSIRNNDMAQVLVN